MKLGTWALFGLGVFVFLVWQNHHKKTITQPDGTVVTPVDLSAGLPPGAQSLGGNIGFGPMPQTANVAFTAGRLSVDYASGSFPPVILPVLKPNPVTLQDANTKSLGTRLRPDTSIARVPSSTIDLSGRQRIA